MTGHPTVTACRRARMRRHLIDFGLLSGLALGLCVIGYAAGHAPAGWWPL